ncbi:ExeM/NucH family extracellular endonuclease [Agrococcus casei]|uniref:ExeM/NucH family extracellular endonuclease n=1 Tax=Agrococcus casei TaxID=343512 RepID=UPI003F92A80F
MRTLTKKLGIVALSATVAASGLTAITPAPAAQAAPSTGLVISEAYGGGGNGGAKFNQDFIELYNLSDAEVSLDGVSVSYYSSSGNLGASTELTGSLQPGEHYLVGAAYGANRDLPAFEADATFNAAMSGSKGSVEIASGDTVIDLVGWGDAALFEGAPAHGTSNSVSVARVDPASDTDDNSVDFATGEPTPQGLAEDGTEEPPVDPPADPETATISEIQGEGAETPFMDQPVITQGIVTAVYTGQGSKNGFNIQEPGVVDIASHTASTGVFVYGSSHAERVQIGDSVEVHGTATEYYDVTQIEASSVTALGESLGEATAVELAEWPTEEEVRELFEGMLLAPQGTYTVSNNYALNQYGEVGLAFGDSALVQPTEVGAPGSDAAYAQAEANAAASVLLDDGQTWDYMSNDAAKDSPLPYLTLETPVTIGAVAAFTDGVVLDYSHGTWRFQPTQPVHGTENAPVAFSDVREQAPEDVGGDITIGTFNVLNYFTTLGDTEAGCEAYEDRDGNPIATDYCTPRGAYDAENFERQQAKIVTAINTLDASVVALEEIEDSSDFGNDRDASIEHLVGELNAAADEDRWAFVPSPEWIPATGDDVIRTGYIYKPAEVSYIEGSAELLDDAAFENARAPFAALFAPADEALSGNEFLVIANHFKSKGGSGDGDNANRDDELGPAHAVGGWNGDRVRQAEAVVEFADTLEQQHGTDLVFITGDLNSYAQEDPVTTILNAGYTNLTAGGPEYSYAFGGMVGSLDHVLASEAATALVTGADLWTINAYEPVALEYSRHNYNVAQLYAADQFRSSDHNPALVGVSFAEDDDIEADEPLLVIEQEQYTQTESIDGVSYAATGLREGTAVVELIDAGGSVSVIEGAAQTEAGALAGEVSYETEAGERLRMPVGTYTLRVTQEGSGGAESIVLEAAFEVVADETGDDGTGDDGSFDGDEDGQPDLPETGFDGGLAPFVLALALMLGGTGFVLLRRRNA